MKTCSKFDAMLSALSPAAAILVLTASSLMAENVITMGYGEGAPGDRDVQVIVTATNDMPIHGYSIAFTFPTDVLTCSEVTTEGTHIASTVQGGPEFVAPSLDNQSGVGVLGVIFDFDEPASLKAFSPTQPGDFPRIIARLTFSVKANAPGGAHGLRLVDGVGRPASFNRFADKGQSVKPRLVNGTFVVNGGNVLTLEKKIAFAGAAASLPVLAFVQHPTPLAGFQIAFTYNKDALTLPDLDPQAPGTQNATYLGTSLGFELGERKIEAFNFDVDLNFDAARRLARTACAVLFDFAPPFDGQTLSPSTPAVPDQSVIKYTVRVNDVADDAQQWQDIRLENTAIPGAVDNRFIIGDASFDPRLVDGKIYFSQGNLLGKVIDSDPKTGVAGVKVVTEPDGFTATTGPSGAFRMEGIIPGKYTLLVSKSPVYYQSRLTATEAGQEIIVRGAGADDNAGSLPIFKVQAGTPPPPRPFVRSNANGDVKTDLSDAIFILSHLFQGAAEPGCLLSADVNDDNKLDISDTIYLLSYLFTGGAQPLPPFSLNRTGCDFDPTPGGQLDCKQFVCLEE